MKTLKISLVILCLLPFRVGGLPQFDKGLFFMEPLTRKNQKRTDGLSASLQTGKAAEHLSCAILLIQGFNAVLVDAGLPYDILIDLGNGKFGRVQVKSTTKMLGSRQDKNGKWRHSKLYRFAMRAGRKGDRRIDGMQCDYFAFVALDRRIVAFMKHSDVVNPISGFCKLSIEMKTRSIDNNRKGWTGPDPNKVGKFMEDYKSFII